MLWKFQPQALSIQQLHVRVPLAILRAHWPAVKHRHNDDDENFKEYQRVIILRARSPAVEHQYNDDDENKGDHLPNKAQFSLNPQNHDRDDDEDLFKEEEAKDGESCSEAEPDCCLVLRVVVIVVLVTS